MRHKAVKVVYLHNIRFLFPHDPVHNKEIPYCRFCSEPDFGEGYFFPQVSQHAGGFDAIHRDSINDFKKGYSGRITRDNETNLMAVFFYLIGEVKECFFESSDIRQINVADKNYS